MKVVCLDTYKTFNESVEGVIYRYKHFTVEEAKEVGKELQKGYMKLMSGHNKTSCGLS